MGWLNWGVVLKERQRCCKALSMSSWDDQGDGNVINKKGSKGSTWRGYGELIMCCHVCMYFGFKHVDAHTVADIYRDIQKAMAKSYLAHLGHRWFRLQTESDHEQRWGKMTHILNSNALKYLPDFQFCHCLKINKGCSQYNKGSGVRC